MTTDNNGSTEPPNDQAEHVAKISEIRVDSDTVVKHFSKNLRNKDVFYAQKSFQIRGVLSEGPSTIDVAVDPRDGGAWYSYSPHPVWLKPSTFVYGWSHDEHRVESEAADIGLPNESENKRIIRETFQSRLGFSLRRDVCHRWPASDEGINAIEDAGHHVPDDYRETDDLEGEN